MSLLALSGTNSVSGGYEIDNSVKMEADNTEYMDRVITTQGNQKTFTISAWVKRTEVNSSADGFGHTFFFGGAYGNEAVILRFNTGTTSNVDALQIGIGIGTTQNRSYTQRKFRDTSAWYHIVLAVDTTQATATDRFKLYVNGVLETEYASRNNPAQNLDTGNNKAQSSTYANNIGAYKSAGTVYGKFCGYIAEVYNIDGSALAPTDFGEFDDDSGIWKPKAYTGSFPNNSFYLDFKDSSDLGAQAKGDDRNFTTYNIAAADQATDTPTNNFATWNVLDVTRSNTQGVDMVEGAMSIKHRGTNGWTGTMSSIAVSKSKWYWEAEVRVTNGSTMWGVIPVSTREANVYWETYIGSSSLNGAAFYDNDDGYYHDATFTACTIGGSTFNTVAGDVIMIAVDMDNNKLFAGVNGSWCNSSDNTLPNATGITILDEPHFLATATYTANTTNSYNLGGFTTDTISSAASDANGYGTFEYAPPSGYYALCTKNLAEYG